MSGLPIQYDEGFIEGPGGSRLHAYWRQGRSDAPLLWNVHGFQGDGMGNKAIALLESAARNNLSFISVDFRGHGQSSPTHANGRLLGLCHESLLRLPHGIRGHGCLWGRVWAVMPRPGLQRSIPRRCKDWSWWLLHSDSGQPCWGALMD